MTIHTQDEGPAGTREPEGNPLGYDDQFSALQRDLTEFTVHQERAVIAKDEATQMIIVPPRAGSLAQDQVQGKRVQMSESYAPEWG